MGKSIFTRLLITYLLLTLLLTVSLALLLSYGFNRYVFAERQRVFTAAAGRVENLVNNFYQGKLSQNELQIAMDNLGYITDSTIYALKVDKASLKQTRTLKSELERDCLPGDLRQILEGTSVYRKKQFSKMMDMDVVFMGMPLNVDRKIIGAVLIFSPLSEINSYLTRINAIIGGTALLALIISFFFIYVTAARISRPIREMEQAALGLAAGESPPDLSIKTGDEVEILANSFNYMKKQVEATERMRREFIANVSHDLRTPLTSINGFVQAMLDGLVPADQYPKYLGLVREETQRLIRLTGDILELAKIQSGSIVLHKSFLPVRELLDEIVGQFDLSGNMDLTIKVVCSLELRVLADPDRLRQVLYNLIGNAIHYSDAAGKVKIQAQEEETWVLFSITDSGIGIDPEDLPYIFERFYRGHKSRSGDEGSGLGLSIAKNLVELHGGVISAESQVGQGSTFAFCLPLA